jgi:putative ABC transport system ATP-binding protein
MVYHIGDDSNVVLQTRGLTKAFERRGERFFAVEGVSLAVAQGDFVCITGQSGSGKSTLLNLIVGMVRADGGEILFGGEDVSGWGDDARAALRSGKIGYIPQGASLLQNFSVIDNVCLPWRLAHRADIRGEALALLDRVGIAHLAQENPRNLSGGEARRVAIARSLVAGPKIIVADEPTGDLDPASAGEVFRLFASAHGQGVAVVVVTHDRDLPACATRHLVMEAGRIREAGHGKEAGW